MASLSKTAAHALRHAPWLYAIELDDGGWVDIAELAAALSATPDDIREMAATSPKNRYELRGDSIRARYGHSFAKRVEYETIVPPARLFHGTAPESLETIFRDGLLPRSRQYVHLALDEPMAREVGRRKSRQPILLTVDAARAHAEGVAFYRGNEKVILSDRIPPHYLTATP